MTNVKSALLDGLKRHPFFWALTGGISIGNLIVWIWIQLPASLPPDTKPRRQPVPVVATVTTNEDRGPYKRPCPRCALDHRVGDCLKK